MISAVAVWLAANSDALEGVGALAGAAAAIAAWLAARATSQTVAEMREARLQSVRPHFELELGATTAATRQPDGTVRLPADWCAIQIRNSGSGPARDVTIGLYCDPSPSIERLLKSGQLLKLEPTDASRRSMEVRLLWLGFPVRAPEPPYEVIAPPPSIDIRFTTGSRQFGYETSIPDILPGDLGRRHLSEDELLGLAIIPIGRGMYGASFTAGLLQIAYRSAGGENLTQEFWITTDLEILPEGLAISLSEAVHHWSFRTSIRQLKAQRKKALRWLKRRRNS